MASSGKTLRVAFNTSLLMGDKVTVRPFPPVLRGGGGSQLYVQVSDTVLWLRCWCAVGVLWVSGVCAAGVRRVCGGCVRAVRWMWLCGAVRWLCDGCAVDVRWMCCVGRSCTPRSVPQSSDRALLKLSWEIVCV